ncbi:hypothetical protein D3879_08460 [Pseudomonas cavernicola]|uniref:Uncharacterized protein n=1 Tax=Pseudomonas cavernicola TaxID=2320866 RepID=A0A418XLF7_9PSED|nr:hypothetical protein [Pseudomonas cavernicola]RJG13281.1 hypothetical protein D3879_08460 [Pseudomonas cavernicola]
MYTQRLRSISLAIIAGLVISACSEPVAPAKVSFINQVWRVSESSTIARGMLYVFLSDGTLVLASANNKPAFGAWKAEGAGLTMIEEGRPYKVEVLKLSRDEFRLRIHNPGQPVEITLVPADQP